MHLGKVQCKRSWPYQLSQYEVNLRCRNDKRDELGYSKWMRIAPGHQMPRFHSFSPPASFH